MMRRNEMYEVNEVLGKEGILNERLDKYVKP
jgi:hypothetical protein